MQELRNGINDVLRALNTRQLESAVSISSALLQNHPTNPDVLLLSGIVAEQSGDYALAVNRIRKAIELRPAYAEAHYNLANALRALGETEEAITHYQHCIRINPKTPECHINLADLLQKQGNVSAAITQLSAANEILPRHPQILARMGELFHADKQLQKAIACYEDSLAVNPKQVRTLNNLGIALKECNAVDRAISVFERATQENPDSAVAYLNLAAVYTLIEKNEEGLHAARKATELDPNSAGAFYNLAAIQSKNFIETALREACDAASKAIQLQPDYSDAHHCLAIVLLKLSEIANSINAARQAIKLDPSDGRYYITLSEALFANNQPAEAIDVLRKAVAAAPALAETHRQLGIALLKTGQAEAALELLNHGLTLDPADQRCIAHKAIALHSLGRHADADYFSDPDSLVFQTRLPCPPEYQDIDAFNLALAEEIQNHPSLQWEPIGLAAKGGSLAQNLLAPAGPAIQAFKKLLLDAIFTLQSQLEKDPEHPFTRDVPHEFDINIWATLLSGSGEISTHIHEESWLSGAYYVQLPPEVDTAAESHHGWIEFGRPNYEYGYQEKTKLRFIQPEEGALLLFPSYIYHRTIPFQSAANRISISFDLTPK
ncbi:MAG: tetratricopeptide repeat protein [Gammaproteobacteria bacterium]|nr:tetratricopeptide repeat protein [Gammaproteobacteria bacterium]